MTVLEIEIIIITTKDVKVSDFNGTSYTYVKLKTTEINKIFPSLINPVFNKKFNYKTKVNEIITFKLYDYYFINKDYSLRESKLKLTLNI